MRGTIRSLSLAIALTSLVACSSAPEAPILQQFFRASRLNDTTSLASFATATFQPQSQGTIASFDIVSVSPEKREPLGLSALAEEVDGIRAEEAAFTKRKDTYYLANQEAITRVLKAESVKASVGGKDAEVQAEWSKLREESSQHARKVSEAQRKLKSESAVIRLSLDSPGNTVDPTKGTGELVTKEVTIDAPVRLPDGSSTDRTLVITMQRAVIQGTPPVEGKWIISSIRDATSPAGAKTS
jgi:hypothetical protein